MERVLTFISTGIFNGTLAIKLRTPDPSTVLEKTMAQGSRNLKQPVFHV